MRSGKCSTLNCSYEGPLFTYYPAPRCPEYVCRDCYDLFLEQEGFRDLAPSEMTGEKFIWPERQS